MCVGSPTAGTWSSSQWRPDNEFETDRASHRGQCGNAYVRGEELVRQFGEILKQVRIPTELAGKLSTVL